MGRNSEPVFLNTTWNTYYARWYDGKKQYRMSLGTTDKAEAYRRLPIVKSTKMSWSDYEKSIGKMRTMVVNSVDSHKISPPLTVNTTPENISNLVGDALKTGGAFFDPVRQYWIITSMGSGIQTDSTAMQNFLGEPIANSQMIAGIDHLKSALGQGNNTAEIETFYRTTMPQLYVDKKTAVRFAELWLDFLREKSITTWAQITEQVCIDFKIWRKTTPIVRNNRPGTCPSNLVVNRHMQFLHKSFDEAVACEHMRVNPIRNWRPDAHMTPPQHGLTIKELEMAISDPRLQKNYLMNGLKEVPLGYTLADVVLLLFAACKRRKEILSLKIDDINFKDHWVHYVEYKNSSKGTAYSIHKAFWISPGIDRLLRRIIGPRTSGPLFPCPSVMKKGTLDDGLLNPDYVSAVFKEVVDKIAPEKDATLHNLRHTATDILERAGLTDQEQDYALGHYNVKTALRNYQDKSADAIARRLSELTRKGIEVLSNAVDKYL